MLEMICPKACEGWGETKMRFPTVANGWKYCPDCGGALQVEPPKPIPPAKSLFINCYPNGNIYAYKNASIAEKALTDEGKTVRYEISGESIGALARLVELIQSAGLDNLTRGVQLGQTSWFVKTSDAMAWAKSILFPGEAQS